MAKESGGRADSPKHAESRGQQIYFRRLRNSSARLRVRPESLSSQRAGRSAVVRRDASFHPDLRVLERCAGDRNPGKTSSAAPRSFALRPEKGSKGDSRSCRRYIFASVRATADVRFWKRRFAEGASRRNRGCGGPLL